MSSLQQLVLTYFRGVDEQDFSLIFETLAPDCVFSVETHGVELHGHEEIHGMFDRLWSHHSAVRHDRFHFVDAGNGADIAVRFRVTNTLPDGKGRAVHRGPCLYVGREHTRPAGVTGFGPKSALMVESTGCRHHGGNHLGPRHRRGRIGGAAV